MSMQQRIEEQVQVFQTYMGVTPRALAVFAVSLAGAALVSTAVYWAVFGVQHWNNEMTVAGRIMTAAATTPLYPAQPMQQQQSGQYLCPTHGAVGLPLVNAAGAAVCPICGSPMQFRALNVAGAVQAAFAGG